MRRPLAASLFAVALPVAFLAGCQDDPPPPPKKAAPTPPPKAKAPPRDTGTAPTENRPPRVTSISWDPVRPTTLDHLRVTVETVDPDGDYTTERFQWYRNGEKVVQLVRDNVPAAELKKGDVLEVEVTVQDRDGLSNTLRSPEITVGNATPVFNLDPRSVRKIDGLKVVAEDPDDEPLTYSLQGGPRGMRIDKSAGVIRYEGSKDEPGGHYTVQVVATDPDKAHATWRFEIDVSPGSAAAGEAAPGGKADAGTAPGGRPARRR